MGVVVVEGGGIFGEIAVYKYSQSLQFADPKLPIRFCSIVRWKECTGKSWL